MKMFKYYITNDVDTDYKKHFPGREECVACDGCEEEIDECYCE